MSYAAKLFIFVTLVGSLFAPLESKAGGAGVVVDAAGRRINTEKPFVRIISLYGAHTENLFALGLEDEIVGVSPHEVYPKAATCKPIFSYHDGPEKFLAARPDLILIRPMIDRGYQQLVSRLERSGITIVSLQPHGIEEVYRYWENLGRLGGRQAAAQRLVSGFKKEIVARRTQNSVLKKRTKVYFEAIHRRMKTFAPGALALFCLEVAGGDNIATDAIATRKGVLIAPYGKERILSHAHEIDVFLAQRGTMNRVSTAEIMNEPGFKVIKAVQQKKVYVIDETIISRPTLRLIKGIDKIAEILYHDPA